MIELLSNQVLWTALIASAAAQALKLLIYRGLNGRWESDRLWETGGMPSSHSATVSALALSTGFHDGFETATFAMATVLAIVVMYDATGVRWAAGLHAQRLNDLMEELQEIVLKGPQREPLKELLGHTYLEVLAGSALGLLVAWASFAWVA